MAIRLKVTNPGMHGKGTKVFVNDADMTGSIQRMSLHWDCADANKVDITFLVKEFDVETKAFVRNSTLLPDLRRPFRWLPSRLQRFIRRVIWR